MSILLALAVCLSQSQQVFVVFLLFLLFLVFLGCICCLDFAVTSKFLAGFTF